MRTLLLLLLTVAALQATTVREDMVRAVGEKKLFPDRKCVDIAERIADRRPTMDSQLRTFFLTAKACEKPSLIEDTDER